MLEACALLAPTHDFAITFCGEEASDADRAMRGRLQERAEQLGLSARVQFIANLSPDAMAALYREADIFVLPALDEPAAVSPIEAVWNGCVALLDRTSGTRHYLPPGDAFVFDGADPRRHR